MLVKFGNNYCQKKNHHKSQIRKILAVLGIVVSNYFQIGHHVVLSHILIAK